MKKEQTYSEAFVQLEQLIEQLEEGDIQLEELAEKVKQANELIVACESKLRTVEEQVREAVNTAVSGKRKKE
jgi:exodeoxyribonuclease VII small subunit